MESGLTFLPYLIINTGEIKAKGTFSQCCIRKAIKLICAGSMENSKCQSCLDLCVTCVVILQASVLCCKTICRIVYSLSLLRRSFDIGVIKTTVI